MHDEVPDETMEDGVVEITLETELDEVATRERTLPRPELDVDVADGRRETHFAMGGRLVDVDRAHCKSLA